MLRQENVKRLIVNADDFGLDPAVNCGIIQAHELGIVTNTSLLCCGAAFDEAAEFGRNHKDLGVGIHLALNEENPVSPRDKISSLLDKDKECLLSYADFLKKFLSGRIALTQVYLEFESQINKFIGAGLRPTHLDSHKHIHLIPGILEVVLELAVKFHISGLRLPRLPLLVNFKTKRYPRAIGVWGLSVLSNIQLHKIKKYLIKVPDYCYGLIESGRLTEADLAGILNNLPNGTNEIICHPGLLTPDLSSRYKWGYHWLTELNGLSSPVIKTRVKDLNIQLIRYDEIR